MHSMVSDSSTAGESGPPSREFVELQEQLAFQQRLLDQLNSVLLEQQSSIEELRRELAALRSLVRELREQDRGEDLPHEKPPHY